MTGSTDAEVLDAPDAPWAGLSGTARHGACLTAARAGDRRGLDVLVTELTPLVWSVARAARLDISSAEDVVQTVWLALLKHLDSLEEPRALVGWLVVTTRRESWRLAGIDRRTCELPAEGAEVPDQAAGPEELVLREDRERRLWAAYATLSVRCRELLGLTVLAGRSEYAAVGEALGMPHGSIGPTRSRCLSKLRVAAESAGVSR